MTRQIVKEARGKIDFTEIDKLLDSEWHEARLAGFLLLVEMIKSVTPRRKDSPPKGAEERERISAIYLEHARKANNWDLVDLSCPQIVGTYLLLPLNSMEICPTAPSSIGSPKATTFRAAHKYRRPRTGYAPDDLTETLSIASKFFSHPHDLIHKSVDDAARSGQEITRNTLTVFNREVHRMPRTALCYAIESVSLEHERQYWLHR